MEARNKRDESNIVWSSAHTMRGPTTLGYRTFRQALIRNLWDSELNLRWNALSSLQSISGAKAQQIPDKNQKSNPFLSIGVSLFCCGWMIYNVLVTCIFKLVDIYVDLLWFEPRCKRSAKSDKNRPQERSEYRQTR